MPVLKYRNDCRHGNKMNPFQWHVARVLWIDPVEVHASGKSPLRDQQQEVSKDSVSAFYEEGSSSVPDLSA